MDRRNSPSLSSFRDSSSMLATLAKTQETGNLASPEQQKVFMTSLTKAMKRRSPCKQDEFWEALQSHYNYLMDEGLIKSCKEANGELSQNEDMSLLRMWTFGEFTERYKELCESLDKMRTQIGTGEVTSTTDKEVFVEEFRKLTLDRKVFNDQSQRLVRRYPDLAHEIGLQVTHINTSWSELERIITIDKPQTDAQTLVKDISQGIRCLRKWLRETETKLRIPSFYPGCSLEDLEDKYKEQEALQKDIESRGKNVFSVLKLCERLQSDKKASTLVRDAAHVHKVALNLERRWHATWLKSLECHCLLEELIQKCRSGILPGTPLESSLIDEPLKKYPRLSGEWIGNSFNQKPSNVLPDEFYGYGNDENWNYDEPNDLKLDEDDDEDMDEEFCTALEEILESPMKTRDIGTGNEPLEVASTNDKGVMVGTTGIAELKASHEGSFEPFEIIQDVGYSSESSTHLSAEERSGESIQIYSYQKPSLLGTVEINEVNGQEKEMRNEENDKDRDGVVNRSGPNCATFYFRHVDTDNECKLEEKMEAQNPHLMHSTPVKSNSFFQNVRRSDTIQKNDHYDALENQNVNYQSNESSSGRLDWSEDDFLNGLTDIDKLQSSELDSKNDAKDESLESNSVCQNSIYALVEEADRLVRKESLSDLVGFKKTEPLKLGEAQMKANRLKEWLRKQHSIAPPPALPPATVLDSSCDASGECTSNDSDEDQSDSSEEQNSSVIMCQQQMTGGATSQEGSIENAPTSAEDSTPKVVMRNKKRGNGSRPWSVTELYQLTNRLDLSPFSISESALNNLIASSNNDSSHLEISSPSIEKGLSSSSTLASGSSGRKTKPVKTRRRLIRRSDSGSDNNNSSVNQSGGSDGGVQKSPNRRRQSSRGSKSHSSSSGGSKGHSSGTEHYSSEAPVASKGPRNTAETTDSESEPTMIEKMHNIECQQSEELSSLSEQAWDDYQESPYLSEAYSEKQLDEDLIRRLVNFGDDYSAFIESQSDNISIASYRGFRPGRNNRKQQSSSKQIESDSDSDLDDLRHIIEDSCNQLQILENKVRKHLARGTSTLSSTSDYVSSD